MLKHGKSEQHIIEQCIRERAPFPDFIQNAPELLPGLELYYAAYRDLGGDRGGMGGPISWVAIKKYCGYYDLNTYQFEAMQYHFRKLDEAYNEIKGSK